MLHFVGFRNDEYVRAIKIWGEPDFIHMGWDKRAYEMIFIEGSENDVAIFADKNWFDKHAEISYQDTKYS